MNTHFSPMRRSLLAAVTLSALVMSAPALAGDFFERNGVAIDGYDPTSYFSEGKPVRGSRDFPAEYQGSVFYFASAANRERFQAAPADYAPQFGGFCAYGAAGGYKAKIDPTAFSVVAGKLYLNYNAEVQSLWVKDITGYIHKAELKWPTVATQSKVFE